MKWYDKMMKKIIGNVKMKAALNFETSSKDIFHWYQLWLTGKETNEVSVLINFMFFLFFYKNYVYSKSVLFTTVNDCEGGCNHSVKLMW